MSSRKAWALGLAAACAAAVSLTAMPSAMAATCTHPSWSNKDTDTGTIYGVGSWLGIKSGPNDGCPVVINVSVLNVLQYDCYTRNSAGNTWTHVTTATGNRGWIYDGNLNDGGSVKYC